MTLTIDIQIGETSYIYLQVICKINKVSRINRSKNNGDMVHKPKGYVVCE